MAYAKAGILFTIFSTIVRLAGCSVGGINAGTPAPALDIAEWIQGEAHDVTDGSRIYLVEFWRSTCPFCVAAVPEVAALQDDYADCGVAVVTVTPEDPATVRAFIESQNGALDYTVAIDNNYTSVKAYGVTAVPLAFLIGTDGKILWKGQPKSPELREKLDELCAK